MDCKREIERVMYGKVGQTAFKKYSVQTEL